MRSAIAAGGAIQTRDRFRRGYPLVGSFKREFGAGDSTRVALLVTEFSDCLTVDTASTGTTPSHGVPGTGRIGEPFRHLLQKPTRILMRDFEQHRARMRSIEPAVVVIQNSFSSEQALCLMTDKPWADYRVLLVTRDRVLQAASHAVINAGGQGLADVLLNVAEINEAVVWQAACEQLEVRGLFCAWPVDLDGQAQFLQTSAALGLAADAERLVKSISTDHSRSGSWKPYISANLRPAERAAAYARREN